MNIDKRILANILGQGTAYGTSLYSLATNMSDVVSIASGLAGACLTVALAYGNWKIKKADARYREAEAESLEIKNEIEKLKLK